MKLVSVNPVWNLNRFEWVGHLQACEDPNSEVIEGILLHHLCSWDMLVNRDFGSEISKAHLRLRDKQTVNT